jgi:hypothetical protein
MTGPNLFEAMLATYPAEKRELARAVYQRFGTGESTEFFVQLFLVLDVYAHYAERIPRAVMEANEHSLATLQRMREELALIAKMLEKREVNITNHAQKTDQLCKTTQAKCDETVARVESLVENLGEQVDVQPIVEDINRILERGIEEKIISPLMERTEKLTSEVIPALENIREASAEASRSWAQRIWHAAMWHGVVAGGLVALVATTIIYLKFRDYYERKTADRITVAQRVIHFNQEAFRQLAIAQVPIAVLRAKTDGVTNPQNFALVVGGADSVEMRPANGITNGYIFFSSCLSEKQIQQLERETGRMNQSNGSK